MILLPDGHSGHDTHWVANTGTHEDALGSDDDGTSYVACFSDARYLTLTYANPSVAEAGIDFISRMKNIISTWIRYYQ